MIQQIRERLAAASKGIWRGNRGSVVSDYVWDDAPHSDEASLNYYGGALIAESIQRPEDREFIAHAKDDIAHLLANYQRDEYHTMDELYEYRMLYHAHAVRAWRQQGYSVGKSWKHSDGELCFGGGWFVVWADIPGAGQITNHYKAEHWDLFHCWEETPPPYDGHTPQDVIKSLRWLL